MNSFMLNNSFKEVSSVDYFSMIIIAIISTILLSFVCNRLFQILQLCGYKLKGYFKWFKETKHSYFSRLFMLAFLSTASSLITNVLLNDFFIVKAFEYFSVMFFVLFASFFVFILHSKKQKTPLKYTKRMMRLISVNFVITFILSFCLEIIGYLFIPFLSFALFCVLPIFMPIVVVISFIITLPIEKMISKSYINKSVKKINGLKNLKVIGITGSYGKTTLKNILHSILSEKFSVCSTPESYNTPQGLSKTILNDLTDKHEIFIAEMGARQKGDIRELCKMVSPKIGIITGVGNQHLMSFGSVDNIIKTKAELAEYVTNNNGNLFINIESENAKLLSINYKNANLISILNQNDLKFENVITDTNGSNFAIKYNNERVNVTTMLLGEHNISNIYLASCVALNMGLSLQEIKSGIEKIRPIPHRLELVKLNRNYTIIDDSFNCSVEGSRASLKLLSKFKTQKIVITPGMVELGEAQYNANFDFGKNLAIVCDYVIIDSQINYKAIYSGLISENFDKSKIIVATSLTDSVDKLNSIKTKGAVVLFENDLPDNYN